MTQLFPEPAPNGASLIEQRLLRLERLVVGYTQENELLREQNRLLLARLYGRSSERFDESKSDVQQLSLFQTERAGTTNETGGSSQKKMTVSSHSRGKV